MYNTWADKLPVWHTDGVAIAEPMLLLGNTNL